MSEIMKKPAAAGGTSGKGAYADAPLMPKDGESVKFRGGKILASASRGGWRVWPRAEVVSKENLVRFGSNRKASFATACELLA